MTLGAADLGPCDSDRQRHKCDMYRHLGEVRKGRKQQPGDEVGQRQVQRPLSSGLRGVSEGRGCE